MAALVTTATIFLNILLHYSHLVLFISISKIDDAIELQRNHLKENVQEQPFGINANVV